MTVLVNPYRHRLGSDTAIGALLGDEPAGVAVDFWSLKALVRDNLAATYEDKFDYADEAALAAAGWTIFEGGGPTNVVVPGDGTVTIVDDGVGDAYIARQLSLPAGVYQPYVDITAKSAAATTDVRFRFGTAVNGTQFADHLIGALPVNAGVYQVSGPTLNLQANPWVTVINTVPAKGMTFGGIKLVRVRGDFLGRADDIVSTGAPSPKLVWGGDGVLRYAPHNLATFSQQFDNAAWVKSSTTVTADAIAAPDGTLTADKLVETAANATHFVTSGVSTPAGLVTVSVYAKAAERSFLRIGSAAYGQTVCDLSTGVFTTNTGVILATSFEDVGGGWVRVSATWDQTGAAAFFIGLATSSTTISYLGVAGSGLHIWGAEAKRPPFHIGPYLPTTTAARFNLPADHDPATLDTSATTLSSVGIGTGLLIRKTLTTTGAVAYVAGQSVRLSDAANLANWILGKVVSYSAGTLIIDAWEASGQFSAASWKVIVALGTALEAQKTNLLVRSQDFNVAWVKGDATVTAAAATAPDGTLTMQKLVEAATTADHYLQQNVATTAGNGYAFSVFAKAGERTWLRLFMGAQGFGGPGVFAWINLATGAVGSTAGAPTVEVIKIAGGIWRISIYKVATISNTTPFTLLLGTADGVSNYLGDGVSGAYLWGAQLEASGAGIAGPSSYIQTAASQVTRGIDSYTLSAAQFPLNLAAHTLYAKSSHKFLPSGVNYVGATLDDGTSANIIRVYAALNGTLTTNCRIDSNAVVQSSFGNVGSHPLGSEIKSAAAASLNDAAFATNGGGGLQTDTTIIMPVQLTFLWMGRSVAAGEVIGLGHLKEVVYRPRRSSNAELQAMVA